VSTSEVFAELRLNNNIDRDIVTLSIRKKQLMFKEAHEEKKQFGERDFYRKKEKIWHSELTKL